MLDDILLGPDLDLDPFESILVDPELDDFGPPSRPRFSISDFVETCNQTLDYSFYGIELVGEVDSFKISKNRWVFFDLKDAGATISCFMTVYKLRIALEDGMRVVVSGTPKLTDKGRFSFTVKTVQPLGEGSLKKSFDLLKAKLEKEGLFAPERKRPLPDDFSRLGVISSTSAAGYADFIKILNSRWGGLQLLVANCSVQGASAADEIVRALDFFNEQGNVDLIVILRGGGSKDDLAVFNDELLVRKIAASRLPVVTGIGHEIDTSLADLAADLRAATPTNAAELLTRDKSAELRRVHENLSTLRVYLDNYLTSLIDSHRALLTSAAREVEHRVDLALQSLSSTRQLLDSLSPETVLKQGYAILSGNLSPGNVVKITTKSNLITAEVKNVQPRN